MQKLGVAKQDKVTAEKLLEAAGGDFERLLELLRLPKLLNVLSVNDVLSRLEHLGGLVTTEQHLTLFSGLEFYYPTIADELECRSGPTQRWPSRIRGRTQEIRDAVAPMPAPESAGRGKRAQAKKAQAKKPKQPKPAAEKKPAAKKRGEYGAEVWGMTKW